MGLVGRILHRLHALGHSLCGWLCFRAGLRLNARKHYERVLQIRGDDFGAYMQLGRIAFSVGDYTRWRRELEQARRVDPRAFAAQSSVFEGLGLRLAGTPHASESIGSDVAGSATFGHPGKRATWRSGTAPDDVPQELSSQAGADRADAADAADAEMGRHGAGSRRRLGREPDLRADALFTGDDCCSAQERQRLQNLGPIRRPEIASCDFDDLSRRLTGS